MIELNIVNLGKYTEGKDVSALIKLPTTKEKIQDTFVKIGIAEYINGEYKPGKKEIYRGDTYIYEEYAIHDYQCSISGIEIGEHENIFKLNELALELDKCTNESRKFIEALLDLGIADSNTVLESGVEKTLEGYYFFEVDSKYDKQYELGDLFARLNGIDKAMGDFYAYFDRIRYGRDLEMMGADVTDKGIVVVDSTTMSTICKKNILFEI